MKLVKFFLVGVLLAAFTFFGTMVIEILLYVLAYSFQFLVPLVEGITKPDPTNPWTYFIMLPAIALSIFFSRKTIEANSLKEAIIEGFGWAVIQFSLLIAMYTMNNGFIGALERPEYQLISIGIFIGPLLNYVFKKASKL